MSRNFEIPGNQDIHEEHKLHEVYSQWGKSHETPYFKLVEYDPAHPHHSIETTVIEPQPSLEAAKSFGDFYMGHHGFNKLINDLSSSGISEELFDRAWAGYSSIVSTFHLDKVFDTPLTHDAVFYSAGDENNAVKNWLVSNGLMGRMSLPDTEGNWHLGTEVMANSGGVLLAPPVEGAKAAGLNEDIIRRLSRKMNGIYIQLAKEGAVIHRSLTQTRAKDRQLKDGTKVKVLPRIPDSAAYTVLKRTPFIVPIPMHVAQGDSLAHVLEPREIKAVEDVHEMYEEAAHYLTELSGKLVVYGMPDGAEEI